MEIQGDFLIDRFNFRKRNDVHADEDRPGNALLHALGRHL